MFDVVRSTRRRPYLAAGLLAPLALLAMPLRAADDRVTQTGLISDDGVGASHLDPALVDAWGAAFVPGGFAYVVKRGAGAAAAYDGSGIPQPYGVATPGPAAGGASHPTGVVANATQSFVEPGGLPAALIFVGEDGVISAWNLTLDGGAARRVVDNSASGASYKGVAIANDGAADFLYATDFHNAKVDVFDSKFRPVTSLGGFKDKTIPKNFAPFGIRNVGGVLYVTYARQDLDKKNDLPGKAQGFVDCFDANGGLRDGRRQAARRQHRRRHDRRVRRGDRPRGRGAPRFRRRAADDRRPARARVRQRRPRAAARGALLRGRPRRRGARPLWPSRSHGQLTRRTCEFGDDTVSWA
jgi:hypothetical protein